jgi:hypothetical protein
VGKLIWSMTKKIWEPSKFTWSVATLIWTGESRVGAERGNLEGWWECGEVVQKKPPSLSCQWGGHGVYLRRW